MAVARLSEALARYEREKLPGRVAGWLAGRKKGEGLSAWAVVAPASARSAGGATFERQPDGSLLASGANPAFDTYTFVLHTQARGVTALRLEDGEVFQVPG